MSLDLVDQVIKAHSKNLSNSDKEYDLKEYVAEVLRDLTNYQVSMKIVCIKLFLQFLRMIS